MNLMLVARNNGVNRRVLPGAQTLKAKLIFVISKSAGDVHGEELGRDLTDHGPSLLQKNTGCDHGSPGCVLLRVARMAFRRLVKFRAVGRQTGSNSIPSEVP